MSQHSPVTSQGLQPEGQQTISSGLLAFPFLEQHLRAETRRQWGPQSTSVPDDKNQYPSTGPVLALALPSRVLPPPAPFTHPLTSLATAGS